MANQEHLDILKQGVEVWNRWRKEHTTILPDLSRANFTGANLSRAHLYRAKFTGANLSRAYLDEANLIIATLKGATLTEANLSRAYLGEANLREADFSKANLYRANLSEADLNRANLSEANLSEADLSGAHLSRATLSGADFTSTTIGWTRFDDIDLTMVKGLETIKHHYPSTIGIDTIYHSKGNIPETFLKGAGVDDTFITYIRALVSKPIDYYSCFISYSNWDQAFADRLYADLQSKGVRCWFAPEDMKIGDKIRPRIDESIRLYDKLLLVLSKHSVVSQWVEHEVETAIGKELEGKPNVLFPIRLDQAVIDSKTGWASHIRLTRHIGDFTKWKNHDEYQTAFTRLLRDLKAST